MTYTVAYVTILFNAAWEREPLGCGMKQTGHTAGQFGGVARFEQFGVGAAKARL